MSVQNDDITPQEGTNPEPEVVEETVEETTDSPEVQEETEELVPKSQLKQALARAKRAEGELKSIKSTKPPTAQNINNQNVQSLSPEEVHVSILKAQGLSDEKIAYLKKLARVNETNVIDAQKDPLYKGYVEQLEAEEKSKKAKLGASRSSSTARPDKNITSAGLTDVEHKELWKKQNER